MEIIKSIKRQDCGLKLSAGNSGETSINLSNEILLFLTNGDLNRGEDIDITFTVFRDDFVKAICFIINNLPLYKTTSQSSERVDYSYSFFNSLYSQVLNLFEEESTTLYTVNLFYRLDGRIYLRNLRYNNFNIRDFLVESKSALKFVKTPAGLNLRLISDYEVGESHDELIVSNNILCNFAYDCFKYFYDNDSFDKFVPYIIITGDDSVRVSKQSDFNLVGLFKYTTAADIERRNSPHRRWFTESFQLQGKEAFLSTQWNASPHADGSVYQLMLPDLISMIKCCYGNNYYYVKNGNTHELWLSNSSTSTTSVIKPYNNSTQKIYFGTPGGGKSHTVNDIVKDKEKRAIRTTFHPDTDYASFVGSYKPIMDGDNIIYSFRPQAFTEAYVKAWNDLANDYYLIIEEISRGNCAQIFGDLFQLLDRKNGYSEYPIKADADLREYLENNLSNLDGIKDGKICLPPNLSILATMNTSDQSLFPMDSAFKRRWDWEYVPSLYKDGDDSDFKITIGDKEIKWHAFLDKINPAIKNSTDSEDKQLGAFFIKEDISDASQFKSKVMFYLWSEICKEEYGTNNNFFRRKTDDGDYKEFTFNELYTSDGNKILIDFIKYLEELEPVSKIIIQ